MIHMAFHQRVLQSGRIGAKIGTGYDPIRHALAVVFGGGVGSRIECAGAISCRAGFR